MIIKTNRHPGRPKGSLKKSTLIKIESGEIEDPRIVVKKHYSHPGRPKGSKKKVNIINRTKKITEEQKLEICKQKAIEWCYYNKADLLKYNIDFFVFRYKNDTTYRRYQIGYDPNDYPVIWLPYTSYDQIIEM